VPGVSFEQRKAVIGEDRGAGDPTTVMDLGASAPSPVSEGGSLCGGGAEEVAKTFGVIARFDNRILRHINRLGYIRQPFTGALVNKTG